MSELVEISCSNIEIKEHLCTDEANEDIRALVLPVENDNIGENCLHDAESSEEEDIEEEKCNIKFIMMS